MYLEQFLSNRAPKFDVIESELKVKVTQFCPILCNPMDYTVHGISRPEYWSGYPLPSSGDFPNPGIESRSPALQADSLPAEPQGKPFLL